MSAQADLFPSMTMTALFDGPNNEYRTELRRVWDASKPLLVVCMLNPSTADHEKNDPTLHVLIHFARFWGYGGIIVINLFAFRSPHPKVMRAALDPVGPGNWKATLDALFYAQSERQPVLCAWGTGGGFMERDRWFYGMAKSLGLRTICLGTTNDGSPKHPLARGLARVPRDQQPVDWTLKEAA